MADKTSAENTKSVEASFSALTVSIAHAALLALGHNEAAEGGEPPTKDLRLASLNIDLLKILRDKTKGNLSSDEQRLIDYVISDLQIKFVQTKE